MNQRMLGQALSNFAKKQQHRQLTIGVPHL